jgi:hypothetical protein
MTSTILARGDIRTRPVRILADVAVDALEAELRARVRGEVRYPDVQLAGPERFSTSLRTASILGIGALLVGGAAWALASRKRLLGG